jgi:Predicted membrane protein (DUF2232)
MFGYILSVIAAVAVLFISGFVCSRIGIKALAMIIPVFAVVLFGIGINNDYVQFIIFSLMIGCITGLSFRYSKSATFIVLVASIIFTAVSVSVIYYMKHFQSIDIVEMSRDQFITAIRENTPSKSDAETNVDIFKAYFEIHRHLIASYTFIFALIISAVGYNVLRPWLAKGYKENRVKGIEFFKLNEYFIFVLIACLIASAYLFKINSPQMWIAFNALIVVGMLYVIQGIGVSKYYLARGNIPTVLIPLFLVGLFFMGTISYVVLVLFAGFGAIDVWVDFRNLSGKKKPKIDD